MKQGSGFTLVELMVAVAIVGILAVVAVPAYQEYIRSGDTGKCAQYILASRLNATNLITMENQSVTDIDADALGLTNSNSECSGGIVVTESSGALIIQGNTGSLGSSTYSRRFIMTRADANGAWSCQLTDSSGNSISSGSCLDFGS